MHCMTAVSLEKSDEPEITHNKETKQHNPNGGDAVANK